MNRNARPINRTVAQPVIPDARRAYIEGRVLTVLPMPAACSTDLIIRTGYWSGVGNAQADMKRVRDTLRREARLTVGAHVWRATPVVSRLLQQSAIALNKFAAQGVQGHQYPNHSYCLYWAGVSLYQEAIDAVCTEYAQQRGKQPILANVTVDPLRALARNAPAEVPVLRPFRPENIFAPREDGIAEPALKMSGIFMSQLYARENSEEDLIPSHEAPDFLDTDSESENTSPEPSELTKDDISSSDVASRTPAEPEQEIGTTCSTREVSEIVAPEDNKYLPELLEEEQETLISVPVFHPIAFSQEPSEASDFIMDPLALQHHLNIRIPGEESTIEISSSTEADAPPVFNWDNLNIPDEDSDRE